MATVFTHAAVGLAFGRALHPERRDEAFWKWSVYCSILPDLDVAGFRLGIQYGDMLGHRGLTHSLAFGALVGWLAARYAVGERRLWSYFAMVTTSHGILDAMTDGGLGIAFLAPFSRARYFFPWTPIHVSPIGFGFFSRYGLDVLGSELLYVWLPVGFLLAVLEFRRRKRV